MQRSGSDRHIAHQPPEIEERRVGIRRSSEEPRVGQVRRQHERESTDQPPVGGFARSVSESEPDQQRDDQDVEHRIGRVDQRGERRTRSCDSPAEHDDPHDHRQSDGADRRIDQREHRGPLVASHEEEATERDQRITHHVRDVTGPKHRRAEGEAQSHRPTRNPSPAASRSQGARRSGRKRMTPTMIATDMETTIRSHTTSPAVPAEVRKYVAIASTATARYVLNSRFSTFLLSTTPRQVLAPVGAAP